MSRSGALIILGVLTVLIPVMGLPSTYRSLITILIGAGVIAIGLSLRTRAMHTSSLSSVVKPSPAAPLDDPSPLPPPHDVSPI